MVPAGLFKLHQEADGFQVISELLLVPCESAQSHFVSGLNLHVAESLKDPAEIAMFR